MAFSYNRKGFALETDIPKPKTAWIVYIPLLLLCLVLAWIL